WGLWVVGWGLGVGSVHSSRRTSLRSEEHTSELQSRPHLVCRLLLEKKVEQEIPRQIVLTSRSAGSRRARLLDSGNNINVGSPAACVFFFNDTGTPGIYPLSLPAALPI